jgi:hypothetical protein
VSVITQSIVTSAARCNVRGGVRACESPKGHGGEHSWVGLTHDAAHRYFVNGAGPMTSVTTALGVLDKPAIGRWAAKLTAEFALSQIDSLPALRGTAGDEAVVRMLAAAPWATRDKTATLGTTVHRLAEQVATGGLTEDITEETLPFVAAYQAWIAETRPEFLVIEGGIWNERNDYAGTLDLIARIGRVTWLIDIKTGKGIYPEHALQLAAYASRENRLGFPGNPELSPLPRIQRAGVLHVRPDGARLVPYTIGTDTHDAFLAALALYRWREEKSKGVMEAIA